jgi:hypothetical protein
MLARIQASQNINTYTDMKPHFQYTADETSRLWAHKRKELHKSMNRSYLVRLFYAIRWKYYSNEIVMGVYDALIIGFWLGLIVAVIFGISIVEYLNPHL